MNGKGFSCGLCAAVALVCASLAFARLQGQTLTRDRDVILDMRRSRANLPNRCRRQIDRIAYRYAYAFDDIGNRESSSERGTNSVYAANQLNQYCSITTLTSDVGLQTSSFSPQFDDDGNQTLVKTETGIWQVIYNGENRPVQWTLISSSTPNSSTPTLLSMSYDRMGRRVTKNFQRFIYDSYLQIAQTGVQAGMSYYINNTMSIGLL